MNTKAKKLFAMRSQRKGISIIEVLTSLAVATIGVFGVLVLIPFAVRQAQLGLDQDTADLVGRNAIEDLQTYGYTAVSDDGQLALRGSKVLVTNRNENGTPNDRSDDMVTIVPVTEAQVLGNIAPDTSPNFYPSQGLERNSGLNARFPRVIHFDPVAVAAIGFPDDAAGPNPDFLTGDLPPSTTDGQMRNDLRVTLANGICQGADGLAQPISIGGIPVTFNLLLDQAEVNRIFRTEDDLIISERNFLLPQTADDAVARSGVDLPQPVFDVSSQGNLMKRQSAGRISWSAIYVPVKDSNRVKSNAGAPPTVAVKYKVYVLVYKDRSVVPRDPDSLMLSALVNRHTAINAVDRSLEINTTNGGFTPSVDQIHLDTSSQGVFKDDWVMLINRKPAPDYGNVNNLGLTIENTVLGRRLDAEEAGYDVQLGFAKVLGVHVRDMPDVNTGTRTTLTVDGGPFDFYYTDIQGAEYGAGPGENAFSTDTYVIHLKNVINVFERTISLERNSVWN